MNTNNSTLNYYNNNSIKYKENTQNADLNDIYNILLKFNPKNILDVGCGFGRDVKFFQDKNINILGVDGSEEFVKIAQNNNLNVELLDFSKENWNINQKFDLIYSIGVVHHIDVKKIEIFFNEIKNILDNNGNFYFSVKLENKTESLIDENGRYWNNLSLNDYSKILKKNNFNFKINVRKDSLGRDINWLEIVCSNNLKKKFRISKV